jgi:UDP-glucose 4-epimerase/UDP-glucuronate decarboxylase
MAEKALITGGAGFIGLHLARRLVEQGTQVTLLDNFSRAALDDDLERLLPAVTVVKHDLTLPLPDDIGSDFDQVYHLAAIVGVRYSNDMPHHVLRTNILATINVLDWCRRSNGAALCFASSSEAYAQSVWAGVAPIPTPETVPLLVPDMDVPRSSYGASKIMGELLCLSYARAFAFPLRVIRYHNVYGPRMGYEHVIPQFIERALERRDPFDVFGGDQSRAFCYVDDAVEATLQLMALPQSGPLIVNVGNDLAETRIEDLARMLFRIVGISPVLNLCSPPAGSPERRRPDLTQLRRLIGYQPNVDLARGLRLTYEWYRRAHVSRSNPKSG